jgi:hypothetical protein
MSNFDVRRLPPALTRGFQWVAGLVAAAAAGVHVATYGPDQLGPNLINAALVLFPVVFLVFGPAVVVLALARVPIDRLFTGLPAYVYVLGFAVAVYVFVDFFAMVQLLPGQPEQDGASFYFNDHGTLIPISAAMYRMGLMHSARLFSGHELIFFGLSALVAHQVDAIRRGRIRIDTPPRDDAMERSRLPYPLQRIVTLQTAQTPEACAQRLLAPRRRSAWSFFDTSRGLRGEASAAGFRVEMASAQSQLVYAVGRFDGGAAGTSINLLLTFKRWPLIFIAVFVLLIPVAWVVMGRVGLFPPWYVVGFIVAFGVVANFLFGLDQRRRLLAEIKQATDAKTAG